MIVGPASAWSRGKSLRRIGSQYPGESGFALAKPSRSDLSPSRATAKSVISNSIASSDVGGEVWSHCVFGFRQREASFRPDRRRAAMNDCTARAPTPRMWGRIGGSTFAA